jgi:hypothetical protein
MPDAKDLPEVLQYIPWVGGRGPIHPDPGPWVQWLSEEVSSEARVQLIVSELQFEKEVIAARSKAIDRNIAILTAKTGQKP